MVSPFNFFEATKKWLPTVLALSLCLLFFWKFEALVIHDLKNRTLISGDDAYFAMVSKTLLTKSVYGLPESSEYISVYDSNIGSGPGLILPGALVMRLAGFKAWVPGATAHVLFILQFLAVVIILSRRFGFLRSLMFATLTIAMMQYSSGWRWYLPKFLGEAPAFGYFLIGAAILATADDYWLYLTGGLFLGVSIMTKQMAIFIVLSSCLALLIFGRDQERRFGRLEHVLLALAGVATPVVLFELYKFGDLGFDNYLRLLKSSFTHQAQIGFKSEGSLWDRLVKTHDALSGGYLFGWPHLIVGFLAISVNLKIFSTFKHKKNLLQPILLFSLAGHTLYFVLASPLWDRYLVL